MKSILKSLAILFVSVAVGIGCKGDDSSFSYPDNTVDPDGIIDPNSVGYLSLDEFAFTVETDVETFSAVNDNLETRAAAPDTDSFMVKIYSEDDDTNIVHHDTYANTKSIETPLTLSAGAYIVEVYSSAEIADADWDCPVYSGSERYVVGDENVTSAGSIRCTLANVMVSVSMDALFVSMFNTDESLSEDDQLQVILATTDDSGVEHELTFFSEDEDKEGYFKAPSDETITIYLTGLYNTSDDVDNPSYMKIEKGNWVETITGVKAGQYRNVSISIKIDENAEGSVEIGITVTTWAYDTEVDVDITKSEFFSLSEDVLFDPDSETTVPFSPVISLDGLDVEDTYTISGSMIDYDLETYSPTYKAYITPTSGSTVASLAIQVSSTNSTLSKTLLGLGFDDESYMTIYEDGTFSATDILGDYITLRYDATEGYVVGALKYAGFYALSLCGGTHTVKVQAIDSEGRASYTTLLLKTTTEDDPDAPIITWVDYDFGTRYQVYSEDELDEEAGITNPEVKINIESQDEDGITSMLLIIDSETLSDELLGAVYLADTMDLVTVTGLMETNLNKFEIPTGDAVRGQTSLTIDISGLMVLVPTAGAGQSDFTIIVEDAKGTTQRTVMVEYIKQ